MSDRLRSLSACFFYLLVPVGSSVTALALFALFGASRASNGVGVLAGVLTAGVALWLLYRREPDFYKALPTRRWLLYAVGLSLLATLAVQCIPLTAPAELQESLQRQGFNGSPVLDFAGTVLVAPLAEELVFRGLILDELRQSFPLWAAVLLSGSLFGLLHGHLLWGGMAFCMALVFAWLRLRTNTLYAPVAAHAASNLLSFFFFYANM